MVADSIWHIAKAPALEVLEHTAAQQAIGGRCVSKPGSARQGSCEPVRPTPCRPAGRSKLRGHLGSLFSFNFSLCIRAELYWLQCAGACLSAAGFR